MRVSRINTHRIAVLALAFIVTDVALAQGRGGRPQPPPIPEVDKESLIFSVPNKWYPYSRSTDNKDETFMFPTGQKPEKWTRMFRVEQFFSNLEVERARQIFDMRSSANAAACEGHDVTLVREQQENGYSMALWSETCGVDPKNTTVTLNKVIVGAERLYIVSKIWKKAPSEREVTRWQRTFNTIFVCDPNTENNPCSWLRDRADRPGRARASG